MAATEGQRPLTYAAPTPATDRPWRARRTPWTALLGLVLIGAYLASGIFVVATDEQAVVRRFGRIVSRLGPGIHYRVPWPVDRVDTLKTTTVMQAGVGFVLPSMEGEAVTGMELLTGDTNIIGVAIVLQYVIQQPAAFLFEVETPRTLIGSVAEAVLTAIALSMPVDEVLTTGRLAIQEQVKAGTQAVLDRYRSGIQLTSANIMTITLDKSVAQAFQDVVNAQADRDKKINEARTYVNNLLPKARGEAHSLVLAAQSAKEQEVAEAVGNASRFLALLAEYEKAPEITRARLYLEALEKILPKVKKYIVDSQQGRLPMNLRLTNP
jgi:modulator of FtsH protease HflK